MADDKYEIEIQRNGVWPTPWKWTVTRTPMAHWGFRVGWTFTKDRARRQAVRAKLSMENEDVRVEV